MKIKTSELTGVHLDWAVATANGLAIVLRERFIQAWLVDPLTGEPEILVSYRPSKSWSQGGPIIDCMPGFILAHEKESPPERGWTASLHPNRFNFGPTALVASMRCFVASKLGDEVDVPEELTA